MNTTSFERQFLIAMPTLNGSFFEQTLIYIVEHDSSGTTGIIVNKAHELTANDLLQQVDAKAQKANFPILIGGPVKPERGFVIHKSSEQSWGHQSKISDTLFITSSSDILEAKACGKDIAELFVALGYCGWSEGQLEQEIADNAWLTVNTPAEQILSLPITKRLSTCLNTVGISYQQLHSTHGHG